MAKPLILFPKCVIFGAVLPAANATLRKCFFHFFPPSFGMVKAYKSPFCCNYINFAYGNEDLAAIYNSNLPRLQKLKKRYNFNNIFGQWFSFA